MSNMLFLQSRIFHTLFQLVAAAACSRQSVVARVDAAAELNAERCGPHGTEKDEYYWRCGPNSDPFLGKEEGVFPAARHTIPSSRDRNTADEAGCWP